MALEFREALSVLMDTANVQVNRLSGGKYKSANNLSKHFEDILTNAYSYNFTNQTDEGLSTLPFYEWDTQNTKWKIKANYKLIIDFLFRQYGNSYCICSPSIDDDELVHFATLFMDSFLDISVATFDKYNAIINAYTTQEAHLLDGVKTSNNYTNINKYKDTPQGSVSIEDLGDDYNTNVTINENEGHSEDMKGTPIERLNELEAYQKVLENWANEFRELFWEV